MIIAMSIDRRVQIVLDKVRAHVEAEVDRAHTYGMLGGDVGVTDEERAKWDAAPTMDDIEEAIREVLDG